jgi:hypothetical protein
MHPDLDNDEARRLATELAHLTGESPATAVIAALRANSWKASGFAPVAAMSPKD